MRSPAVVVALFQRLAYFEREYDVYEALAASGATVTIAFSDGTAHEVPPGCHGVTLDPGEALADEWTVIAVGPQAEAFLVATDAHLFDAGRRGAAGGTAQHPGCDQPAEVGGERRCPTRR